MRFEKPKAGSEVSVFRKVINVLVLQHFDTGKWIMGAHCNNSNRIYRDFVFTCGFFK